VMSNDRGAPNGASTSDVYGSQAEMNHSMQNGYAAPPVLNGMSGPLKRGRDDEDDPQRPQSGNLDQKRRKTLVDGAIPAPGYDTMNRPTSAVGGVRRR
jgi:protein SOK2